jgi:O-methyltransferase involved in polyketide biosynthesis
MSDVIRERSTKPATAARIYDYLLGGTHNFAADQEAARKTLEQFPLAPAMGRANRAFLRRAVRYLTEAGVRQFLDIGSGMPTQGNVHEIAQQIAADAQVVYVDIDPVAVSESLEILADNDRATAIHADLRQPQAILDHPLVRKHLDFDQPIALLLMAVLHFVPDDDEAHAAVSVLLDALAPGSYLAVSHVATEGFDLGAANKDSFKRVQAVYRQETATPGGLRTRDQLARFLERSALVDPGLVWITRWRPEADDVDEFGDDPRRSGWWAGLGKITA